VEDPPADRAEQPFADEQAETDGHNEPGEQDRGDGDAGQDRDRLDLVEDVAQLGAGEVAMRGEESLRGRAGPTQLVPEASRVRFRRWLAGRRRGRVRLRVVQGFGLQGRSAGGADDTSGPPGAGRDGQAARPNALRPNRSAVSKKP
jgi:hypothetical protein